MYTDGLLPANQATPKPSEDRPSTRTMFAVVAGALFTLALVGSAATRPDAAETGAPGAEQLFQADAGVPCVPEATVTVKWEEVLARVKTESTLQVVMNPLLLPESPMQEALWQTLDSLNNAPYARLQGWHNYAHLVVPQLHEPTGEYLCAHLNGDTFENEWHVTLECPEGFIDDVQFASWGNPTGVCGAWQPGQCNRDLREDVLTQCMNKARCEYAVGPSAFGLLQQGESVETALNKECPTRKGQPLQFAVQVTCSTPQQFSNWNFDFTDPIVSKFMEWADGSPERHTPSIALTTAPNWLFDHGHLTEKAQRSLILDCPYNGTWNYTAGTRGLAGDTATGLGEYYARIVQYYTQGGFYDEYDQRHDSDFDYDWNLWEVLNEPELAYPWMARDKQQYNTLYDQVVLHVLAALGQSVSDPPDERMQFVGLNLGRHGHFDAAEYGEWISTFLDPDNHRTGIPRDYLALHYYAHNSNRTDANTFSEYFFTWVPLYLEDVKQAVRLRDELSPDTKIYANEVGVIPEQGHGGLGSEEWQNWDGLPIVPYSEVAMAGFYAEMYAEMSLLGIDIVGQSWFSGYGALSAEQFPASNGKTGITGDDGDTSMTYWLNGKGTAKILVQKLIEEHLAPDEFGDTVMLETVVCERACAGQVKEPCEGKANATVFARGYKDESSGQSKILLVNHVNAKVLVRVAGAVQGDLYTVQDTVAGHVQTLTGSFFLEPFSVAVFYPRYLGRDPDAAATLVSPLVTSWNPSTGVMVVGALVLLVFAVRVLCRGSGADGEYKPVPDGENAPLVGSAYGAV